MGRVGSITTPPSIKSNPNSRYHDLVRRLTKLTKQKTTLPFPWVNPKNIFLAIIYLKKIVTTEKKFRPKFFPTKIFFDQNFFDLQLRYFQATSKLKSFQAEHYRPKSCLTINLLFSFELN